MVEQRLNELLNRNLLNETAETRVELLPEALERVQKDAQHAFDLELLITLRRELAEAWYRHPHTDRAQAFETTIGILKEVLLVYTVAGITLNLYGHVIEGMQEEAMGKMDDLFKREG